MPRIEEYRTFCTVVEARSFSQAAAMLGISQPAVSQQIKALERIYGTPLLLRSSLGVTPTEQGQAIYEYATQIVGLYDRSKLSLCDQDGHLAGRLAIGASTGLGEAILPSALAQYKKDHPGVHVALHVADSDEILERVILQRIEIGFVGSRRRDQHLRFEPFIEDQLVLVFSPEHPLAQRTSLPVKDLPSVPLILQQEGSGATHALRQALEQAGLSPDTLTIVMQAGLQESTKNAVMSGLGGTVISRLGASEELRDGRLVEVPIEGVDLAHPFFVATQRLHPLTAAAERLIDLARETARRASQGL